MKVYICSPTDLLALARKRKLTLFSYTYASYMEAISEEGSARVYVKMSMPEGAFLEWSIPDAKDRDGEYFDLESRVTADYEAFLLSYGQGKFDGTLVSLTK